MKCVISQMRTGSTAYAESLGGADDYEILQSLGSRLLHGTHIPNREIFEFYYNSIIQIDQRFEMFKQLEHKPTIKIIPGLVKTSIIDWCIENLDCTFLDRKNKLDQILSYGVAKYSSWWFNQGGKILPPGCMEYLRPDFDYLISSMNQFNQCRTLHSQLPLVYYEDLVISTNSNVPTKNTQRGLELFSNSDQIMEWYNEFVQR